MFIGDKLDPSLSLIHAVHRYYPIGINILNEQFDGFQELRAIMDSKFKQLSDNAFSNNIGYLREELRNKFREFQIDFDDYKQFPSFSFAIELDQASYPTLQHSVRLVVKISLLINYYTIFFEEYITNQEVFSGLGPARVAIISLRSQTNTRNTNIRTELLDLLQECLQNYHYVDHESLFKLKIHYGLPLDAPYITITETKPVYNYLFDNQFYQSLLVSP